MSNHRNLYVILFLFDEGERPGADITLRFPSAHYASNNHFKAFLASLANSQNEDAGSVQTASEKNCLNRGVRLFRISV